MLNYMKPKRSYYEVRKEWASELATKLNRSIEQILERGLSTYDFLQGSSVEIYCPPDCLLRFKNAFALIRAEHNEAVIFTEHHGYLEFMLLEGTSISEISAKIYSHSLESDE